LSDIFEEVEESIRQDKASLWWKKFGPFVWALGLLVIAAVGYREWAIIQKAKAIEAEVQIFEEGRAHLDAGDYEQAQTVLKELADSDAEIGPLAAQYLAKAYYEGNGDAEVAASTLRGSGTLDGPIERISFLKSIYLRADTMNLVELEAALGDMPKEPTALGALALELIAAKALKEGDIARARKEFSYLRFANDVPGGVAQRAEIALSVIPVPESVGEETTQPAEDSAATDNGDDTAPANEDGTTDATEQEGEE